MVLNILQVNDNHEIIKTWEGMESLLSEDNKDFNSKVYREKINQALKKGFRSLGYYWIWEHQWQNGRRPGYVKNNEGVWEPSLKKKQIRYKDVYAYKHKNMVFVGRFKHAVEAGKFLHLSPTNIRHILNDFKKTPLKGYWFINKPLHEEDDLLADIKILERKIEKSKFNSEDYNVKVFKLKEKRDKLRKLREKIMGIG